MSIKFFTKRKNDAIYKENNSIAVEKCAVYYIPCDKIRPNPMRSRSNFDEDKLVNLAYSIKRYGIIEPLCVMRTDADDSYDYALITGERRLRAARLNGISNVPCIIFDIEQALSAEISLIENISHLNIDYFEVAAAIKRLSELYEESFEEIASRLSISQDEALKKLLLLEFDFEERQLLLNASIPEDIALEILKKTNTLNRKELIKHICALKSENIDISGTLADITVSAAPKALSRDASAVIRGLERRIRLLNRYKKRASYTVNNTNDETVIVMRIKG